MEDACTDDPLGLEDPDEQRLVRMIFRKSGRVWPVTSALVAPAGSMQLLLHGLHLFDVVERPDAG